MHDAACFFVCIVWLDKLGEHIAYSKTGCLRDALE